jgi:hypothetical protein
MTLKQDLSTLFMRAPSFSISLGGGDGGGGGGRRALAPPPRWDCSTRVWESQSHPNDLIASKLLRWLLIPLPLWLLRAA